MMRIWAVVEYGQPLQLIERPLPELKGTEVLVRNFYSGVCHSDLHNWEGKFNLGAGKYYQKPKELLPHSLGHEMEGEVVAVGPDVSPDAARVGGRYMVFPWIGCGPSPSACQACKVGQEQLCNVGAPKRFVDGNSLYGGYSSHVVVPHPKYLIDNAIGAGLPEGLGCVYMCSGLTAFGALKKIGTPPDPSDVVILGCGGLGLQAVLFAKALFGGAPRAADVSPTARAAAEAMGCTVYDPSDKAAIRQLRNDTNGGAFAVIDFVGGEVTTNFANKVTRRGSTVVIVGLFGGEISLKLFPFVVHGGKMTSSFTGSIEEVLEMFQLIKKFSIKPIPHAFRPMSEVNDVLKELSEGKIVGRCILKHDAAPGARL